MGIKVIIVPLCVTLCCTFHLKESTRLFAMNLMSLKLSRVATKFSRQLKSSLTTSTLRFVEIPNGALVCLIIL